MLSRLSFRSVRSLTAALAVAALLAVLALPVQAAPRTAPHTIGPIAIASLVSWVQEFFAPLAEAPALVPTPERVHQQTGQCMDPNGKPVACPDAD